MAFASLSCSPAPGPGGYAALQAVKGPSPRASRCGPHQPLDRFPRAVLQLLRATKPRRQPLARWGWPSDAFTPRRFAARHHDGHRDPVAPFVCPARNPLATQTKEISNDAFSTLELSGVVPSANEPTGIGQSLPFQKSNLLLLPCTVFLLATSSNSTFPQNL